MMDRDTVVQSVDVPSRTIPTWNFVIVQNVKAIMSIVQIIYIHMSMFIITREDTENGADIFCDTNHGVSIVVTL